MDSKLLSSSFIATFTTNTNTNSSSSSSISTSIPIHSSSSSVLTLRAQATPPAPIPTTTTSCCLLLLLSKDKDDDDDDDDDDDSYSRRRRRRRMSITKEEEEEEYVTDDDDDDALFTSVILAKKALLASREAASIAQRQSNHQILFPGLPLLKDNIVRSTRNAERQQLNRRRTPKSKVMDHESNTSFFTRTDFRKKNTDPNDPLRFFLGAPETKKLLNAQQESKLILHIQDSLKLEQVKTRLHSQFNREPTLVEWAQVLGISCQDLQIKIRTGCNSREKLIYANLRMVVHIAKQYLGRGLSFQDLLQEGSLGLMKSVEKFKPQAGCRFASYAYWWIRQSIRKAIFHHSRTIRLPDNVYSVLGKVLEAKKLYIQEAHRSPTKEELAQRVGITVEKLEGLLFSARFPLSIQQPVWSDQDTTFQEITADTSVEIPDVSVGKQIMRRHIRNLLNILSPREKRIIRLRYGIEGGERKSLSDIGMIYGLSKERVRQLESRAFYKLKQRLDDQGLAAYADLLV